MERILARVAERGMAKIVGKGDCLGEVFIEPQAARDGARNLGNLQTVRESCPEKIAFVIDENLRLVFEAPESRRMNDPVAVALIFTAAAGRRFPVPSPA
jgi:hypothetical protein